MRQVEWEGAVNARHVLGGLYRMGRSEWLTERGWRQAYDDGVRTVIDLRNADERSRRPTDPAVPDAALAGITVVHRPTEDQNHAEFMELAAPYLSHPRFYPHNLRFFPDKVAAVVRALAAAEGKVIMHCSAGRDRTGLMVTLLLLLADRRDLVEAQYDAGARGINDWHRVSPVKHPYERYLPAPEFEPVLRERVAALAEFADGLAVEEFLLGQGCTSAQLAAVRRLLADGAER
ncbi:tyrosine-protein phosphatase [Arthrobacter halodurans]|uniref:Tyrosine-protein phosphatase n=1 Tax=Arthrobacter halodurans TaxID=516699 RepID=A0ABV4UP11_9MICC